MKKSKDEYVEIQTGEICKVIRRNNDTPLYVGQEVIVEWNETTMLCRTVKRIVDITHLSKTTTV